MTPSEKCEHCGTDIIHDCLRCFAPNCCPSCCARPTEEAKCECDPEIFHICPMCAKDLQHVKLKPTSEPREPYLDEDHLYRKYEALRRANDRNMREKFEWRDEADSLRTQLAEAKAGRIEALNAYEHMVNCHSDRVKELEAERAKAEKLATALEGIADYQNSIEQACSPESDYMAIAREALAEYRGEK